MAMPKSSDDRDNEPTLTNDQDESDEEQNELREMISKFFDRSSIPAVSLVRYNINRFWKILWLIIAMTGFSVSIYQSVQVINNYLSYPSFTREFETMNTTVLLPAITLCPRNFVNWKKIVESNHSIYYTIEKAAKATKKDPFDSRYDLETLLLQEIHKLPYSEREKFLYQPKDWIDLCLVYSFGGDNAQCEVYMDTLPFYTPYYGYCVTINPGLINQKRLHVNSKTADLPPKQEFPYLDRLSGISMAIHPPGSAPVIPWHTRIRVLHGEWLHTSVSVYERHRLPYPFHDNCTSNEDPLATDIHKDSPYSAQGALYEYTREECMANCYQWTIVEEKACINPFLAANEKMDSSTQRKLCTVANLPDPFMMKLEQDCSKECQKRCREYLYSWIPVKSNLPRDKNYVKELVESTNKNDTYRSSSELENSTILITLNMNSVMFLTSQDLPQYTLGDIFGAVGGNLGLWVGVSILSLFEVFELITNIFMFLVLKLRKKLCRKRK